MLGLIGSPLGAEVMAPGPAAFMAVIQTKYAEGFAAVVLRSPVMVCVLMAGSLIGSSSRVARRLTAHWIR